MTSSNRSIKTINVRATDEARHLTKRKSHRSQTGGHASTNSSTTSRDGGRAWRRRTDQSSNQQHAPQRKEEQRGEPQGTDLTESVNTKMKRNVRRCTVRRPWSARGPSAWLPRRMNSPLSLSRAEPKGRSHSCWSALPVSPPIMCAMCNEYPAPFRKNVPHRYFAPKK